MLVLASPFQDPRATARAVVSMDAQECARIHVVAVQSPPTGHARMFLRGIQVRKLLNAASTELVRPLCSELDASGVRFDVIVEVGPWLPTIERLVRDLGCTRLIVGTNPGDFARDCMLRHDAWRIGSYLRSSGITCGVVRAAPASSRRPRGDVPLGSPHAR
jgi:hypothetical protein